MSYPATSTSSNIFLKEKGLHYDNVFMRRFA